MGNEILHIYTRVSTTQQKEEGYSLEYQRDLGIKKATELGMEWRLHNEEAKSASEDDISTRPILSNLMSLVRDNVVKQIFVYEFSRLSRHPILQSLLGEDFRKHGVVIHLQNGKYDLSQPIDEMVSSIMNAVGRYEKMNMVSRSKLGLRKAYELGKTTGSIPPLGYRRDESGYLVIDEEEAKIYRKVVNMGKEGISPAEIARILNKEGIPTKFSKYRVNGVKYINKENGEVKTKTKDEFYWKQQTILHILSNEIYFGKRRYKNGFVDFQHPLITQSEWEELQECCKKRVKSSIHHNGGKRRYFYLLKGVLRCNKCGNNLCGRININTSENTYYCSGKRREMRDTPSSPPCSLRSINIGILDELVWETLVNTLKNSHLLKEETKKKLLSSKDIEAKQKTLRKRIQSVIGRIGENETQASRLLDLYTQGKISKERFEEKDGEFQKATKQLLREKDTLDAELEIVGSGEKWVAWLDFFAKEMETLAKITQDEEKQQVIRRYVDEIRVDSVDRQHIVKINLKIPMICDKIVYNNPSSKKEGYRVVEGDKTIVVASGRKKNNPNHTLRHKNIGDGVVRGAEGAGHHQRLVGGQQAGG